MYMELGQFSTRAERACLCLEGMAAHLSRAIGTDRLRLCVGKLYAANPGISDSSCGRPLRAHGSPCRNWREAG